MSVQASDIKFLKSVTVTDTGVNGGRKGQIEVVSGARHNLFPRVTKAERTAGVTRYRKEFWANLNADDDIAYDVVLFLEYPSNGGDRYYIGQGEQNDTQSDILGTPPLWMGAGTLNGALSGGETQVSILMESDDFEFEPGGFLHIANKILTGQTIASGVQIGDSVEEITGTWTKIANQTDIAYPYGIYLGSNNVLSEHWSATEEFLEMETNLVTDEDIGTGDGSTNNPTLTDLASVTNGLVLQDEFKPVVQTVCGGTLRTVYIETDGTCSGYCSAGEINPDTGVWVTDIFWTTPPDDTEDILITYYDKNYSYTGNVVAVDLVDSVANPYAVANTIAGGCIRAGNIGPEVEDWSEVSASGTFDESTYPLTLYNDGVEYDVWTITFTSATAFTVTGLYNGGVGSGVVTANFEAINPSTGEPFFTLDYRGWGGIWASGDTVQFTTIPGAVPVWWKEIVPAGTAQEPDNITILGWYAE